MAGQKGFDGVMVGLVAKFPLDDTHEFAVMDGGRAAST